MRSQKGEEIVNPSIVFEDKDTLVLNKPSGWIVNDAITAEGQPTIQQWLKENFSYQLSHDDHLRSGIVHRLDKETSGILLVAKTPDYFDYLQSLFRDRKIKKTYKALLHGNLEPEEGVIEAEVGRLPWNRRRFGVLSGGRHSKTSYKVQARYTLGSGHYSLAEFFPETGRTHQIRIHARHIGHPVVGDTFYAGRKTARADRAWCPRLFLHATSISFTKLNAEKAKYKSELPAELKRALSILEKA